MKIDPLIGDAYSRDLGGKLDLAKLVTFGEPWSGIILKATEGVSWGSGAWFPHYWPLAKSLAGDRFGKTWLRGAYHYVHFKEDWVQQRDFYLKTIDAAGGWDVAGDIRPILDVERADNPDCSAQQIVDTVSMIANGIYTAVGARPILYGGSLIADKGIKDHMGCSDLWIARYSAILPHAVLERIGWHYAGLWQYDGDGEGYLAHYPWTTPIGKLDISAVIHPDGLAGIGWRS